MLRMLKRLFARLLMWSRMLYNLNGTNLYTELGLFISAFTDSFLYAFSNSLNCITYVSGIFHSRTNNAYFFARGRTDDLYYMLPKREKENEEFIKRFLEEGDRFIDIGANVGYYSILASRIVGKKGQVISLEPHPDTSKILELNLKLNGVKNVSIMRVAASDRKSTQKLYVPEGGFGYASTKVFRGSSLDIETVPLDEICGSLSYIKIIKMDVEGAEYDVLSGANRTLKKTRALVIENTQKARQVAELLRGNQFRVTKLRTGDILAYKSQKIKHPD